MLVRISLAVGILLTFPAFAADPVSPQRIQASDAEVSAKALSLLGQQQFQCEMQLSKAQADGDAMQREIDRLNKEHPVTIPPKKVP